MFILAVFAGTASLRLGTLPAPWQDEPWLMQPAHELLTHGKLGLPMFRNRGNNLENKVFDAPVFYVESTAWYGLFGFGLLSARAFNLTVAVVALLLVFAFARRTQGALGALLVVALVATDGNFFDGARMIRNDFAALMHAWIAFNLFAWARERNRRENDEGRGIDWRFALAGVAAGLVVQTHLNGLYVLGIFGLWLLMDHGFDLWRSRIAWSVALGVGLAFVPFAVYCATDWPSFVGQWKGTPGRYSALQGGLLDNISREWKRYAGWGSNILNNGGARTRLPVLWMLIGASIAFLGVKFGRRISRDELKTLLAEPWTRTLAAALFLVVFFTVLDEPKSASYVPHLLMWFALLVGEAACLLFKNASDSPKLKTASVACVVVLAVYGAWTALIFARYVRWTQSFAPAPYSELARVLREVVPSDLTPVGYPTHWLAFVDDPKYLACKSRFWRKLPGKEYVFIVDHAGIATHSRKFPKWLKEHAPQFTVLAELENTAYGDITVYYTGTDSRRQNRPAPHYRFNGPSAGFERLPPLPPDAVKKPPVENPRSDDSSEDSSDIDEE